MSDAYDRIGAARLEAVIADFVGRMARDPMIGFFFARVDLARLEARERQLAAAFLGAPGVVYEGRALRDAHSTHRIFGGQFDRRRELLRQVLVAHEVPEDVRTAWLAHVESLRAEITVDAAGACR